MGKIIDVFKPRSCRNINTEWLVKSMNEGLPIAGEDGIREVADRLAHAPRAVAEQTDPNGDPVHHYCYLSGLRDGLELAEEHHAPTPPLSIDEASSASRLLETLDDLLREAGDKLGPACYDGRAAIQRLINMTMLPPTWRR